MAHANLHVAAGLALATALTSWPVARAWLAGAPLARPLGRLLLVSYALGAWAVMPNLATRLGADPAIHHAPWANVFVGHALIDARTRGGLLIGELAIVAILVLHYAAIVAALARAERR
ncbi:MAG: hypothetical protein R3B48_07325 [Kofleriaceae bacterium]